MEGRLSRVMTMGGGGGGPVGEGGRKVVATDAQLTVALAAYDAESGSAGSSAPPGRAFDRLLNGLGLSSMKTWTADDAVGHLRCPHFVFSQFWRFSPIIPRSTSLNLFFFLSRARLHQPAPPIRWLLSIISQATSGPVAESSVLILKLLCRGASPLLPKEAMGVEGASAALLAFLRRAPFARPF